MVTNEFIDMLVNVIPETRRARFMLKMRIKPLSSVIVNNIIIYSNTH